MKRSRAHGESAAETLVDADPLAEMEAEEARLGILPDWISTSMSPEVESANEPAEDADLASTGVGLAGRRARQRRRGNGGSREEQFRRHPADFGISSRNPGAQLSPESTMLDLSSIDLDLEAPESNDDAGARLPESIDLPEIRNACGRACIGDEASDLDLRLDDAG